MACFWQGIQSSLGKEDKIKLGITNSTIPNLIKMLKNKNTRDIKVLWQNKVLSKKEKEENYIHIKDYNINSHRSGYLCSTCDPFLILLSHTLNINIKHNYLNNIILYTVNSKNMYIFKSNQGHFMYKNKILKCDHP